VEEPATEAPAWASLRASIPPPRDERFPDMPLLRDDGTFPTSRPRSVALWRGIAVMALATAVAAMVVAYQREVGNSLIWLGETLSGKTKASGEMPEKTAPVNSTPEGNSASATPTPAENGVDSQKPEEQKPEQASTAAKSTPESTPATAAGAAAAGSGAVGRQASRLDTVTSAGRGERQQSALDRQQIPRSSGNASPGATTNPES
jgi:hypothetical protein